MIITAFLSAALMLSSVPAPTVSAVPANGVEASYVRKVAADGTIILSGQDHRDGQPFRFTVKDGQVRGWIGNQWVSFPLSEAAKASR